MTKKLTDEDIDRIAERTDADLDPLAQQIDRGESPQLPVRRGRGRPPVGSGPSLPLRVRVEPELRHAVDERARAEHTSTSDIVRQALRRYLNAS